MKKYVLAGIVALSIVAAVVKIAAISTSESARARANNSGHLAKPGLSIDPIAIQHQISRDLPKESWDAH